MSDPPSCTLIHLAGRACSLVLEARPDRLPVWRHWGRRVSPEGAPSLGELRSRSSFSLNEDRPLTTAPGFGAGDMAPAALMAHRDGRDFTFEATGVHIEQAGDVVRISADDTVAELRLEQEFRLDPTCDSLSVVTRVTNQGTAPLEVLWLAAATLPLPATCASLRSYTGRHNAEFVERDEPMPAQAWRRERRDGLTGHSGPPGVFALDAGAGRHGGTVYGVQLAWSGNCVLEISRSEDGGWILQAGEWLAPGEMRLAPGETYETPELLATCSPDGLNGVSQNFHAAIRARVGWPGGAMRPRQVHLNSWEGFYFDHDEARLMALADRAAELGVERFVLDDGWFRGRNDDTSALGDWTPDPVKYPHGLGPLARHVLARGMTFGLWVEPEMVNPDSNLHRAHPEWALQVAGRARQTARNQLVLDLGRAEVRDHLFGQLDGLLARLPIGYLKWDHNRRLTQASGQEGRPGFRAQVLGAYDLLDRLRAAHPEVEIEACAAGGGRIDAGIIRRTHRFWTSDNIDALSRLTIQRGFLAFMPPELMGAHVGASPAHATGRRQSMGFRAAVALPGHFGVELDPAALSAEETEDLGTWLARYRDLRGHIHGARVWLGEAADGVVWQAHGDLEHLILLVYRADFPQDRQPPLVRLPMLAGVERLRVRLLATTGQGPREPAAFTAMRGEGLAVSGSWLAQSGLPLPPMTAESCAVFELTATSSSKC